MFVIKIVIKLFNYVKYTNLFAYYEKRHDVITEF